MASTPHTSRLPADVVVVGYGDPFHGDDGVRFHVATVLEGSMHQPSVRTYAVHELTADLVDPVGLAKLVIFIDASVIDPPGAVRAFELKPASGVDVLRHRLAQAAAAQRLLAMARLVHANRPRAYVIRVGGKSFQRGDGLSPQVRDALPEVVDRVQDLVAWWCGRRADCLDLFDDVLTYN